jgi:hypothetical protein
MPQRLRGDYTCTTEARAARSCPLLVCNSTPLYLQRLGSRIGAARPIPLATCPPQQVSKIRRATIAVLPLRWLNMLILGGC